MEVRVKPSMPPISRRRARVAKLLLVAACLSLVLACLATVSGPAGAAVRAKAGAPVSAVNGFALFKGPQSQWDRQLAAMRRRGIQVVRSDAAWGDIQPQAPTLSGPGYQWSTYDAWAQALAAN